MFGFMGVSFGKEGSAAGMGSAGIGSTATGPSLDFSKSADSMYINPVLNLKFYDPLPMPEEWQPQRIFATRS